MSAPTPEMKRELEAPKVPMLALAAARALEKEKPKDGPTPRPDEAMIPTRAKKGSSSRAKR